MPLKHLGFAFIILTLVSTVLISVLGIWGVISGVTALKLFYTLAVVGLGAALLRALCYGPLNSWRT